MSGPEHGTSSANGVSFMVIPGLLLERCDDARAIQVFLALARHADQHGECWPTQARVAGICRCSLSSVERSVRLLVHLGLLRVERRYGHHASLYRVARVDADVHPVGERPVTHDGSSEETRHPRRVRPVTHDGSRPVTHDGSVNTNHNQKNKNHENHKSEQLASLAARSQRPVNHDGSPSRRDLLFEAVCEVCGIDWHELTDSGRGAVNRACAQLRKVGATPGEVHLRAEHYAALYDGKRPTAPALAKHWAAVATLPDTFGLTPKQIRRELDHTEAMRDVDLKAFYEEIARTQRKEQV